MDFKAIKHEYETTKTSFRKLGQKYNINYKRLERRAKKEKWIKFNKKTPPKATITPTEIIDNSNSLTFPTTERDKILMQDEQVETELNLILEEADEYEDGDMQTTIMTNLYYNAYKLYMAYERKINYDSIEDTPPFLLQQVQVQINNLKNMGEEIKKSKALARRKRYDEEQSRIHELKWNKTNLELYDKNSLEYQNALKCVLERHIKGQIMYEWERKAIREYEAEQQRQQGEGA